LLRTLSGFNAANPSLSTWGEAEYCGAPLGERGVPALVSQSARLMIASVFENVVHDLPGRAQMTRAEQQDQVRELLHEASLEHLEWNREVVSLPLATQRHLALVRLVAADPRLIFVDEPTTDLDETSSEALLDYLRKESARRAMFVVLHNQEHARRLGGRIALLAGGVMQEVAASDVFFSAPQSAAGRQFVRYGSCSVPSPDARPEELDSESVALTPSPAGRTYVSDACGPRGFLWMKKGRLAGTPRPGIVLDLDYDLEALRRVGVTMLISLTQRPMDEGVLSTYGIKNIWSPIPDMHAPKIEQAKDLCGRIEALIENGDVVAVHCRAGLGRTGTMLAAYLIWEGQTALDALDAVRRVEPKWMQSDAQVTFLKEFAVAVADGCITKQH
jgi:atypical dual specificity phosphatase